VSSLQISCEELADALASDGRPLLLDVRETEENAFTALPNSTLIPLHQLPARVGELDKMRDADVVVYCHHGVRSLHAIRFLQEQGFTRLRNLIGGIDAWSRSVDPKVPRY